MVTCPFLSSSVPPPYQLGGLPFPLGPAQSRLHCFSLQTACQGVKAQGGHHSLCPSFSRMVELWAIQELPAWISPVAHLLCL